MKSIKTGSLLLTIFSFAFCACGDNRPVVQVRLRLAEPLYRLGFSQRIDPATGTSQLSAFENDAARAIEKILASRIGFLRFTDQKSSNNLTVTLERAPGIAAHTQIAETLLRFRFEIGPRNVKELVWPFRSAEEYTLSVESNRFMTEIASRVAGHLEQRAAEAVTRLFSHIPLCHEVYVLSDAETPHCILPFSYEEIEVAQGTWFEFEVPSGIDDIHFGARAARPPPGPNTNLPPNYARGIIIIAHEAAARMPPTHRIFFDWGTTNGPFPGRGLYVTAYVRGATSGFGENAPSSLGAP